MGLKDFDWKAVVGTVAPALATALGGPLAGVAVSAISKSLLGKDDGTEEEVAAAIQSGGADALLKLREANNAFTLKMRELDINLEEIHHKDRASARAREERTKDHWTPRILAATIIGGFLAMVASVLLGKVTGITDPVAAGMIGTLIGYVSAKADQVVSYYFGSSAGSAEKTALLSKPRGN
jgi:hypothetical protein